MAVTNEQIKQLRELTGAGVMDCKRALEEADGDIAKAQKIIQAAGIARAAKRAERETAAGTVVSYIHHNSTLGALVELNCETDFVARTDDFKQLAKDVALQVASMSPKFLTKEEIPAGDDSDPKEVALLEQPFVREPSKTIGQMVTETSAKTGEKVVIGRFARFALGQ